MTASTSAASKRLLKELAAYRKDPSPSIPSLSPIFDDDLFHLQATLKGPEGTAYEGTLTPPTTSSLSVC